MYRLQFLDPAARDFAGLDKSVSVRILRKLTWLAENAALVTEEGLRGKLAGLAKLREGDFRIVYQFLHAEKTVVIHSIGHRSEIYED